MSRPARLARHPGAGLCREDACWNRMIQQPSRRAALPELVYGITRKGAVARTARRAPCPSALADPWRWLKPHGNPSGVAHEARVGQPSCAMRGGHRVGTSFYRARPRTSSKASQARCGGGLPRLDASAARRLGDTLQMKPPFSRVCRLLPHRLVRPCARRIPLRPSPGTPGSFSA